MAILGRPAPVGWSDYVAGRVGTNTGFGFGGSPIGGGVSATGSGSSGNGSGSDKGPLNLLYKAIDVAMQPTYFLTEHYIEHAIGDKTDGFKDWLGLGSGNSKISWSDILRGDAMQKYAENNKISPGATPENLKSVEVLKNAPGWAKGVGGFAADVIGDPLTYTGAGIVSQAAKKVVEHAGETAAKQALKGVTESTASKIATSPYLNRVAEHGIIGERVNAGVNAGRAAIGKTMRARKVAANTIAGRDLADKAGEKSFADKLYGDLQRFQVETFKRGDELYGVGSKGTTSTPVEVPPVTRAAPGPVSEAPVAHSAEAAAPAPAQTNTAFAPPVMEPKHTVEKTVENAEGINGVKVQRPVYQVVDNETGQVVSTKRSQESLDKWIKEEAGRAQKATLDVLSETDPEVIAALSKGAKQTAAGSPVVARNPETGEAMRATSKSSTTSPKFLQKNKAGEVTDNTQSLVDQLTQGLWEQGTKQVGGGLEANASYRTLKSAGVKVAKTLTELFPNRFEGTNWRNLQQHEITSLLNEAINTHGADVLRATLKKHALEDLGPAYKTAADAVVEPSQAKVAAAFKALGLEPARAFTKDRKFSPTLARKVLNQEIKDATDKIDKAIVKGTQVDKTDVEQITGWFKTDDVGPWTAKWETILDPDHVQAMLKFENYDEFENAARVMAGTTRRAFDIATKGVSERPGGNARPLASFARMTVVDPTTGAKQEVTLVDLVSEAIRTGQTEFQWRGVKIELPNRAHVGEDLRKQVDKSMQAVDNESPKSNLNDTIEASSDVQDAIRQTADNDAYRAATQERRAFYQEGGELDDDLRADIQAVVNEQLPATHTYTTGKKKAKTDSPNLGEGTARHQNTWNLPAQTNLTERLVKRHSDDFRSINGEAPDYNVDQAGFNKYWTARSEYLMEHVVDDLAKADRYFMAQGTHLHPQLSKNYSGAPLGLGQVLEILRDWPTGVVNNTAHDMTGREFLKNFVFRPFAQGDKKYGKGFLVGLQQVGEIANNVANIARRRLPNGTQELEDYEQIVRAWQTVNETIFTDIEHALDSSPIQRSLLRAIEDENGSVIGAEGLIHKIDKETGKPVPFKKGEPFAKNERRLEKVQRLFEHPHFVSAVVDRVEKNTANLGVNFSVDVGVKAGDLLRPIQETLNNAKAPLSELAAGMEAVEKILKKGPEKWDELSKGSLGKTRPRSGIPADPAVDTAAAKVAQQTTQEAITDPVQGVSIGAVRAQGTGSAANRAATPQGLNAQTHVAQQQSDLVAAASTKQATEAGSIAPEDVLDVSMQTRIFQMLDAGMRLFNRSYANTTAHAAIQIAGNIGSVLQRTFRHDLNDLHKGIVANTPSGLTSVQHASNLLRIIRETPPGTPLVGATEAETSLLNSMNNLVNQIFSTNPNSLMGVWAREGFDIGLLNEQLGYARYGGGKWEIDTAGKTTKNKAGVEVLKDLDNVWRDWEIEDPLDWLAQMQDLTVSMSTKVGSAREFYNLAKESNLISHKPRPGWVKVGRNTVYDKFNNGKRVHSTITRHLPMNGQAEIYMAPDLFAQMKRMDIMTNKLETDMLGTNQLWRMYDNAISMFKSGMTIWRPAHHVRTLIGDISMAHFTSGLRDPKYYYKSLRVSQWTKNLRENALGEVAKKNFRGSYDSWDALAALNGLREGIDKMPKGFQTAVAGTINHDLVTEPITFIKAGNKRMGLTPGQVSRLAMDNGILPDFNVQEDIIKKIRKGEVNGPVKHAHAQAREKLGNFVEGRDDFVRMAHFMHLLENGIDYKGWKSTMSFDDVVKAAAAQVRKAHPDGSDLTPFERKWMRRMFPFYSWTRKAIPLVVENTWKHPGRAMAYPKAMYNLAASQGVDLQSMSEPFPDDQMFPEFVTDNLTGFVTKTSDGRYYTFNMGLSNVDIYNQFFAGQQGGGVSDTNNPAALGWDLGKGFVESMLKMATPVISVPYSLTTGQQFAGPIKTPDKGEIIENSAPVLGDVARLTGYSPVGSIETLAKGQGLDPLRATEKGNRQAIGGQPGWSPEYLFNYFTGGRLTDVSKPSYQNVAELEKRDRAANQKRAANKE